MQKLKHLLLVPFAWLAALIFLIEEAIWDWSAALMARLGAVRIVHRIELHISSLSPRWALFAFLLPSLTLVPAKLLGLHAIATGHWLLGGAILILAKLAGMALFSRIFNLTRPALLQLPWFARLYTRVMFYRDLIHGYLAHWPAYQRIKLRIISTLAQIKSLLRRP